MGEAERTRAVSKWPDLGDGPVSRAYLIGLALQSGVSHRIVNVWLSLLTSWLPVAL